MTVVPPADLNSQVSKFIETTSESVTQIDLAKMPEQVSAWFNTTLPAELDRFSTELTEYSQAADQFVEFVSASLPSIDLVGPSERLAAQMMQTAAAVSDRTASAYTQMVSKLAQLDGWLREAFPPPSVDVALQYGAMTDGPTATAVAADETIPAELPMVAYAPPPEAADLMVTAPADPLPATPAAAKEIPPAVLAKKPAPVVLAEQPAPVVVAEEPAPQPPTVQPSAAYVPEPEIALAPEATPLPQAESPSAAVPAETPIETPVVVAAVSPPAPAVEAPTVAQAAPAPAPQPAVARADKPEEKQVFASLGLPASLSDALPAIAKPLPLDEARDISDFKHLPAEAEDSRVNFTSLDSLASPSEATNVPISSPLKLRALTRADIPSAEKFASLSPASQMDARRAALAGILPPEQQRVAYDALPASERPTSIGKRRYGYVDETKYTGLGKPEALLEALRHMGANAKTLGLPASLWCADFMNMVLRKSGIEATGSRAAKSYLQYGRKIDEPRVGAIAIFTRGKNGGHIGIVRGTDGSGNPIIVSGNHNNKVAEATYPKARVIAYVVPR